MSIPTSLKMALRPFKTLKSFNTPPCTQCQHGSTDVYDKDWYCTNPKAIRYRSIRNNHSYSKVSSSFIRGTRLCNFEEEDEE